MMTLGEYLSGGAPQGERNHALYCMVLQAREEGWPESDIRDRLTSTAQRDGLTPSEINSTIASGLRAQLSDKRPKRNGNGRGEGHALDWNATIGQDLAQSAGLPGPSSDWEQTDLPRFLGAVFEATDKVIIVAETFDAGDGKRAPGKGMYAWTAQELAEDAATKPNATEVVFSKDEGAWVCLCPGDGKGRKMGNIVGYRHALVEFDDINLEAQWEFMTRLRVPCSTVVHSGKKSLHFAVRVDAPDAAEYAQRVEQLYSILERNGHAPDRQNRNPNRLCRLPGVWRQGKPQYLVATDIGMGSWQEWYDAMTRQEEASTLPPIRSLRSLMADPPPLKEEILEGILRRGHKMLLGAGSKGWKTWSLIHLACAVSQGAPWHDYASHAGKVLFLDFELQDGSFFRRVEWVAENVGANIDNIEVWNLRGHAAPLDEITPMVLRHVEKARYSLIILDPLYKVLTGDENSAHEMTRFCNQLELLAVNLDAAVVVSSHFRKGKQGHKAAIDRTSGSGVFGRDPDAIGTLTPLEKRDDACELEWILRDFPKAEPIRLRWECPILRVSTELAHYKVDGEGGRPQKAITQSMYETIVFCGQGKPEAPVEEVVAALKIHRATFYRRVKGDPNVRIDHGMVVWTGPKPGEEEDVDD